MDSTGAGDSAAVKLTRAKPPSDNSDSPTDVDRLSSLHVDILAKILQSVDSSRDAVRTCVLSRRWQPVWKLLPELRLPFLPESPSTFAAALDDHNVPLRHLHVEGHGQGALPRHLATWLPAAARRVTGCFLLRNNEPIQEDYEVDEQEAAAIELPCFEEATSIQISLGLLGSLAMPPAGAVFSNLTNLYLQRVWFHHRAELGDVVSSARSPCLQRLTLHDIHALEVIAIESKSILSLKLEEVNDLQELTVQAPELKDFTVVNCFFYTELPIESLVVAIAAPELLLLDWKDCVESQRRIQAQLSQFTRLRSLGTFQLFVYGTEDDEGAYNRDCLEALEGIRQFLEDLTLALAYMQDIENYEYLMEDVRMLPKVTTLHLIVASSGHSYGASLFHVLKICTGIRKLVLELHTALEEPCPSPDCICRQQSNWKTEELVLFSLQEIEFQGFGQSQHDFEFIDKLFDWAKSLTKVTIIFDESVTEGVAEELCWMFQFFHMPKLHIDFRYHNNKKVPYTAEE